ncbi:MAG: hypothetical protein ACYC4I_00005, partial [Minisyncoccota bacterium]
MTHEQDGATIFLGDFFHLAHALLLELGIADGEDLVDDEYVGLHVRGDRESEADVHAARVVLDGRVEEFL